LFLKEEKNCKKEGLLLETLENLVSGEVALYNNRSNKIMLNKQWLPWLLCDAITNFRRYVTRLLL